MKSILEEKYIYQHILSNLREPEDDDDLGEVIRYRTEVAKLLIAEDIHRGMLPERITNFSMIHTYIDGNLYLIDENHPNPKLASFFSREELSVEGVSDCLNQIVETIDTWLAEKY